MDEIDDHQSSARGRINSWETSLQMIRYNNPLLGVGKGQFNNYTSLVAHNAFLQQLGEMGLVGAYCWLGLMYFTIKGMREVLKQKVIEAKRLSITRGYYLGFIALLAALQWEPYWASGTLFISEDHELFYIWIAMCSSVMIIEKTKVNILSKDLKIVGLILVSGVVLTYIAVNFFASLYL